MSGYLVSDELPLSAMSSSSDLCEMYSQEREPNYKYHQMKIWNEKEEKRREKEKEQKGKKKMKSVVGYTPHPLVHC